MKDLLRMAPVCAIILCSPSIALAQTFTPAPGYSASLLFNSTPGFGVTALAADTNGDIYTIETDSAFTANSVLSRRSLASNYLTPQPLFTFNSPAFGNFIEIANGRLYFGADNSIAAINTNGTGFDELGTVVFNYAAALFGNDLFISASSDGFGKNKVSRFSLLSDGAGGQMLSAPDLILDTDPDGAGPAAGDNSGPIAFDGAGALIYGANKASIDGIFRFTADEVASAFGPSQLTLVPPENRVFANGQNQYLARIDGFRFFQTYSPFSGTPTATVFDFSSEVVEPVGRGSSATGDYFSGAAVSNGNLIVGLTSGAGNTAVYRVVPEPTGVLLVIFGAATLLMRSRRTNHSRE